jgi:DGQHR domain-containing protein
VSSETELIERRGLRLEQPGGNEILIFALAPSEVLRIADIARITRGEQGDLIGYQRPEVRGHVKNIRDYLEGDDIVFPNAIILAIASDAVRFRGSRGPKTSDGLATSGTVEITVEPGRRPAWIVDGQQRALALGDLSRQDLAVPIAAFVTDDVELQRDQFIRVNSTKPLPRGLVTELLPEVTIPISPKLSTKKLPSALCDQLQRHEDSPFRGLIRRPSSTEEEKRQAVVADTSIVRMLEESLRSSSGCLFPYRNISTGEADLEGIWNVVVTYWQAVHDTFPEAWGFAPQQSRLMHGAGIRAMGRLMDKVMATVNPAQASVAEQTRAELQRVAPICRWTSGSWEGLGDNPVPWNAVQNTPRDVSALSNLLIRHYVSSRMAS